MVEIKEIKSLFAQYGYDILEETIDYIVFAVKHSLYPGVDIVFLTDMEPRDQQSIADEYSKQRFAVRICEKNRLDQIEEFLFDWFFQVEATNKQIGMRYKEYASSVLKSYGIPEEDAKPYEYIESPYSIEYNVENTIAGVHGNLIKSISDEIKKKGPSLIIVEAAAGFGKTSTALELLKSYENIDHGIRPFYMELYKDRQAATFRYLLLSQMHREFNVLLGDEIVNINIKKGRIPLIIDGFDELLSEDLDSGSLQKAKRRGETMLSTIAEYLDGDAKIILTTRKTAILSGQEFIDWYSKTFQIGSVRVVRYCLDQPRIEDWLKPWQKSLINPEVSNILNPVLLGYLHYLSDYDFRKECESSQIMKNYINKLLTRERERQDLTITVEEQTLIFKRLASAFAYEDIISESRSNVKDYILLLANDIISKHTNTIKDSDNIANTLSNHALLDRKGNNNLGFVNDFVLGVFLGLSLLDSKDKDLVDYYKSMSKPFIDRVLVSMSLADESSREGVWMQLTDHCAMLSDDLRLQADLLLLKKSISNYKDVTFDGNIYDNVVIGDESSQFDNCHFANIIFTNSKINIEYFRNCTFINCVFNSTDIDLDSDSIDFIQCKKDGRVVPMFIPKCVDETTEEESVDLWTNMLSYYTLVGNKGRKMQLISRIREEYEDKHLFKKVFGQLVAEGYILTNGDKSHISSKGLEYLSTHRNND